MLPRVLNTFDMVAIFVSIAGQLGPMFPGEGSIY
jgi:hypothetical protein